MRHAITSYQAHSRKTAGLHAITKLDFLKTKILLKLLCLGAFTVVLALFYIWARIQIVKTGYEINELAEEQQTLINDNKNLKLELLLMKSPERLAKFATEQLGMALPQRENIVALEPLEP